MKISVIVLTYNSERTIKRCLDSVLKQDSGCEVVVVDNNSCDKTVEVINSFGGKVKLICAKENFGFSKGCNLGVNNSQGDILIFINPDSFVVTQQGLHKMGEVLLQNPDYGIIGPKLIKPDGSNQKTARLLPTPWRAFKEYIMGIKGEYDFYQPVCPALCEIESVVGAGLTISKTIFDKIGGFNEKYFLYFEDLELCRAARNLGLKVGYLPTVCLEHMVGESGKGQKTLLLSRESAKKYHGLLNYYLIELILVPRRIFNKIKTLL